MAAQVRQRSDEVLIKRLLASPEYRRAARVFLYLGVGNEPDTRPAILDALAGGKRVALPGIVAPGVMEAREITSLSELVPGKFAIPAPPAEKAVIPPEAFDLILVPGAAFTREGGRLGRGGGYYDRYLPLTRGKKIALVRRIQFFDALPTEDHDIRVDLLLTDENGDTPCPPARSAGK